MKSLKDRYLHLLHQKDVTAYQVSAKTGISNDVLSRLKNGKTEKISNDNAKLLAEYFGVSKEWLTTGNGEMLTNTAGVKTPQHQAPPQDGRLFDLVVSQQETIKNLTEINKNLSETNKQLSELLEAEQSKKTSSGSDKRASRYREAS